jgi:hypothetical protein
LSEKNKWVFFWIKKNLKAKQRKRKKMEKKGARAVVVSGAIALLIACAVFLLLKWRSGPLGPLDIGTGSGTGSGSWLASLGIGTQLPQAPQLPVPVPTQQPYDDGYGGYGGYGYDSGSGSGTGSAPVIMPVQTIELGDLPSIFPEDEFGVPITEAQFATPARAKGFDDTAAALKEGAFSDERVMPSLSTKNGGMLSTLDVRGDYTAPVLFDPKDRTCGSCDKQCVLDGKWNQSSAQRNIDLGIIKEERRRRIVFADE